MASLTPNLGLKTYNLADGTSTLFQTWRLDLDGTSSSNMTIIDTYAGTTNAAITLLQSNRGITYVPALYASPYSYTATVASITSYSTNLMIDVVLDTTNTGMVGLDINSLGNRYLQKYNTSTGTITNVEANDLRANKEYLFRYSGTSWIWMDAVSADQINIQGTSGNIISINSSNAGSDSGYGFNGSSGVPTLSSGSINLIQIPNHASSGANYGTATSALYGHTKIDVEGGVPSITSGSIASSRIPVDGTVILNSGSMHHGNSGVSAGSYTNANITVNAYGHITAASSGGSGGGGASATYVVFTNSDLISGAGILTVTHNRGLTAPYTLLVNVADNNHKVVVPSDITFSTNSFTVDLTPFYELTGTSGSWGLAYV